MIATPQLSPMFGVGRRLFVGSALVWLARPFRSLAAPPPAIEARPVRIQLDDGSLPQIPGDERADLTVTQDTSRAAQALVEAAPPGRAIPIIFVVVGVLSIPVIWDTIRE